MYHCGASQLLIYQLKGYQAMKQPWTQINYDRLAMRPKAEKRQSLYYKLPVDLLQNMNTQQCKYKLV